MLFFIDESGYEDTNTPYQVLAAVSISEDRVGDFVLDYNDLKREILRWTDTKIHDPNTEIHANAFLQKRNFRWANKTDFLTEPERTDLLKQLNTDVGKRKATDAEKAAKGQSIIEFMRKTIDLVESYDCYTFASVINNDAPDQIGEDYLRKDYSYLFERFAELIRCECDKYERGLIIHDSEDKKLAGKLIKQMTEYFSATGKGRERTKYLCPFPFFAESHLTPFVEIADLAAYCINWGYRSGPINERTRTELEEFGQGFGKLQFSVNALRRGATRTIRGIHYIDDLRPRTEK